MAFGESGFLDRFSGLGNIGGLATSIGSLIGGGGGQTGPSQNYQALSQIYGQTQQNKQNAMDRKTYGDNLAGQNPYAMNNPAQTSAPLNALAPTPPTPSKGPWYSGMLDVGKSLAKDLFLTTAKGIVQNKVNKMLNPQDNMRFANQLRQNPGFRGKEQIMF